MGSTVKQNRTSFIRCPKDNNHPFSRLSAKLYLLNGYQFAIMAYILSNKDNWNLVKYEIGKRLEFPERKFLKAWKELERMGYIQINREWGCYHYTVYEDPGYTTGTDADCMDHTTGSSTSCISATLTNNNNNYYYTNTTGTDADCLKSSFTELNGLYPQSVKGPSGKTNYLKSNIEDCEKEYIEFLLTKEKPHEEIIVCLNRELDERQRSGNSLYQPALLKWIREKRWERYENIVPEPAEKYGQTLE